MEKQEEQETEEDDYMKPRERVNFFLRRGRNSRVYMKYLELQDEEDFSKLWSKRYAKRIRKQIEIQLKLQRDSEQKQQGEEEEADGGATFDFSEYEPF